MSFSCESPFINKSLISLKFVVFLVISGTTALHVLHATKPFLLGLSFEEYRNISIIAPFVSILGPLIAGPLADRLAAKNAINYGRSLRLLTAFFLIISSIIYACLFAVPDVHREEAHRPLVSFGCDASGAVILQERCSHNAQCHNWQEKAGKLNLTRCTYTCQDPTQYENMYTPWLESLPTPSPSTEQSSEFDYEDEASSAAVTESLHASLTHTREKRAVAKSAPSKVYVEPPHLCVTGRDANGKTYVKNCHVYTDDTKTIVVDSVLRGAINTNNDTYADWCSYPLDGFQCQIPMQQVNYMVQLKNGSDCKPMIECQIVDPYESKSSILMDSECIEITGDLSATLVGYTVIRLLGDIFPLAALTLLNTAIVIAVRETSEGRGEVCRQYVWGAIAYVLLFSPLNIFFASSDLESRDAAALTALILLLVCYLLAAVVLLVSSNMPLSPPEWWWHTKTGMLVYPMSAIRRYKPEIILLTLIAILFGLFWSSIHSFLRWSFYDPYAVTLAGLILVLVLFFNVDKFIEFCGHSNIFITGFAVFIIRFTALSSGDQMEWLTFIMETVEPAAIGIIWITVILYMRHVMPRKFTATGQAIAVIAFFGIGKGCGALIGLALEAKRPSSGAQAIYEWLAVAACVIAIVYFIIYNLILAPRCAAKAQHLNNLMFKSASQTITNGGGGGGGGGGAAAGELNNEGDASNSHKSYSPLRVYHNERGKKGQFRY